MLETSKPLALFATVVEAGSVRAARPRLTKLFEPASAA